MSHAAGEDYPDTELDSLLPICGRYCRDGRDGQPGLNGRDGPAGLNGRDGQKGYKGEPGRGGGQKGDKGDPGPKGPKGQEGPEGQAGSGGGGGTYVRWGRTTCPDNSGTYTVYNGWAVGSHYNHNGGGSNYLCLSKTPSWLRYSSSSNNLGLLYGAEYEAASGQPYYDYHNHNVPCTVCHVTRTILMIPGQYTCPTGWTLEYYGYLVSGKYSHKRTTYVCLDAAPESVEGGHSNQNGALFYHVETRCGALSCPPYEQTKEITCAVCSK